MWKRTTLKLTLFYTFIFFAFLWLFSGLVFLGINRSLGQSYVDQVRGQVDQSGDNGFGTGLNSSDAQNRATAVAAQVALSRFGQVLLGVNAVAAVFVPLGAYFFTRRTLKPLAQANEQQKQFVANASHELRTPLAVLSGELELALKKPRSATAYRRTMLANQKEVEHMSRLVQQLLMLTQLDETASGARALPDYVQLDVAELIDDVVRQHCTQANRKHLSLEVHMPPRPNLIHGSPTLLAVAIGNVLDNAVKYSPPDKAITIDVRNSGAQHVEISVCDQGEGIHPSRQARLFDRFYRAKTDDSKEGFGLGLAIVKRIVDLHGGSVRLTSHPGRGTVVILRV